MGWYQDIIVGMNVVVVGGEVADPYKILLIRDKVNAKENVIWDSEYYVKVHGITETDDGCHVKACYGIKKSKKQKSNQKKKP